MSGRPTECKYCRYPTTKGRCHRNHVLAFHGYNFSCVIASGMIFDFRGGFSGSSSSDKVIADFEVVMDVAMATFFGFLYMGCTLAPPGEYN